MDFKTLWAESYRPQTLDDILLSPKNRKFFEALAKQEVKAIPHLLFHGPVGAGKTSLAHIIIKTILGCECLYLNGSEQNSIEVVRGRITNFIQTKSFDGKMKVVFLDEADGLSNVGGSGSSAQKALRNILEEYSNYCRFIFTCNYNHQIIEPIWSRVMEFYICPDPKDYVYRCLKVLKQENISVAVEHQKPLINLINKCYPDLRLALQELQKASFSNNFDPPENIDKEADSIAGKCFKMLINKSPVVEIRKYIIENEQKFMGNYNIVLKGLFESVYNSKLDVNMKRGMMLHIGEALLNNQVILDKEIGFFCCVIKLSDIITGKI